jgi:hypothetical protein
MDIKVMKWLEKPDVDYQADGLVRVNPNKPEYGSIMLMATVMTVNNNFLNNRNRVAFVTGELHDLKAMVERYHLEEGSDFNEAAGPHRIVVLEKLQSEVGEEKGYSEKINPSTGQILSQDGEVIVRKTVLVVEGSDIIDTLVEHDKEPVAFSDESRGEFEKKDSKVVVKTL